jgi:hypothetical protein
VTRTIDRWSPAQWRRAAVLYTLALFLLAVAGRRFVMLDLATTDDENAALFGGRTVAGGRLSVPDFERRCLPRLLVGGRPDHVFRFLA